jgi:hypothetical protein
MEDVELGVLEGRMNFKETLEELIEKTKGIYTPSMTNGPLSATPGVQFFTAGGVPMQPPAYYTDLIVPANAPIQTEDDWLDIEEAPYEIHFELDGWQIESYTNSPSNDLDWVSHYCSVAKWRYRIDQWSVMGSGVCSCCCEPIPEEVIGVWKLKNFDHLPSPEDLGLVNYSTILSTSTSLAPGDYDPAGCDTGKT